MPTANRPFHTSPPRLQRARLPLLLAAVAAVLPSTGCGRGSWANDDAVPFTPHAAPLALQSKIKLGAPTPASHASDPQLPPGGDPLIDAADPLTTGRHDHLAPSSRFADLRSLGAAKDTSRTEGWYWVVGSIQSGQIGITVNGTPIGRYSVRMDKEITPLCHPGLNTVTFTHYPLLGSSRQLCQAHLEVVNGHAPKGAPPVMVYDTAADDATPDQNASPPNAPSSTDMDVLSASGVDSSGNPDNAQIAPPLATPPPGATSAPYSDQRSFSGG